MIEIPDPPRVAACATCAQPVTWLWSARKSAWVGFVPAGEGHAIRPHPCPAPGTPPSWRDVTRRADPPNDAYRAARQALATRTAEHRHTEEDTNDR